MPINRVDLSPHIAFIRGSATRLEMSSAMIDMLAVKRLNLQRNRAVGASEPLRMGLLSEIQEFVPLDHPIFDEMEGLLFTYTEGVRLHRERISLRADMCSFAEDRLKGLIDGELQDRLEQTTGLLADLRKPKMEGFLSDATSAAIERPLPGKPTRGYASDLERLAGMLDSDADTLFLEAGTGYRSRKIAPVEGRTPEGYDLITLEPRHLGIGISHLDGSITHLYRGRTNKFDSVDTAMRSLVHAMESEQRERLSIVDENTRRIIEIMSCLEPAARQRVALETGHAQQLMDIMRGILSDIGQKQRVDSKLRASYRVIAALRLLNCSTVEGSSYFEPVITAARDIRLAKQYLFERRLDATEIEVRLERKYASLYWWRQNDARHQEYLADALQRACEMLLPEDTAERNYSAASNILGRAANSIPKTAYYGYSRAKTKMLADIALLDEIVQIIDRSLDQTDETRAYEHQWVAAKQTKLANLLETYHRSPAKGKQDYLSFCLSFDLDILLGRDYLLNKPVVQRDIRELKSKTVSRAADPTQIIAGIEDLQRRYFPLNARTIWQQDGRRLLDAFRSQIERTLSEDDDVEKIINNELADTRARIAILNREALTIMPDIQNTIDRLTVSVRDNLERASSDLKNRSQKAD